MSEEVAAAAADLATVARLTAERDVALAEAQAAQTRVHALARQLGRCDMAFEIILQTTNATAAHRTARRMRRELAVE